MPREEIIPDPKQFLKNTKILDGNMRIYQISRAIKLLWAKNTGAEFNYVFTNPAFNEIKKRKYGNSEEKDPRIEVDIQPLDNYLSELPDIDMFKVGVEGAEYLVCDGSQKFLRRVNPLFVFEHFKGAADINGIGAEMMYAMLSSLGYNVFLLKDWFFGLPDGSYCPSPVKK